MQRSKSHSSLPLGVSDCYPRLETAPPPFDGADHEHAIGELKRCGFTVQSSKAILSSPHYLPAHKALFNRGNPLNDGVDLGGLLEPLCVVCSAWFKNGCTLEASILLERLLEAYPQAPAAHELLKSHAAELSGFLRSGAPSILSAIEFCVLQPPLIRDKGQEKRDRCPLLELANRLDPLTGLKIELARLRQRVQEQASADPGDDGFNSLQELLALCARAQSIDGPAPLVMEVMNLAESIAASIEPANASTGEVDTFRRVVSLKRRQRHKCLKDQEDKMKPWLQLGLQRHAETQQCALAADGVICIPSTWNADDLRIAWRHFEQWVNWQLEDPQGLPWAALEALISRVASQLDPTHEDDDDRWLERASLYLLRAADPDPLLQRLQRTPPSAIRSVRLIQLIQLARVETLPVATRVLLLRKLMPRLPSCHALQLSTPQDQEVHAQCVRALCLVSSSAPDQCAALFKAYGQQIRTAESGATFQLIQMLVAVLSSPDARQQDHDTRMRLMAPYWSLSLSPDTGAPWPIWRTLCSPLLRYWVDGARHNPWANESFLQALRSLSAPTTGRAHMLRVNAIDKEAVLLADQVAHLATRQDRVQWLRQLDRHCARNEPPQKDQLKHIALRGAIRALLSIHGGTEAEREGTTEPVHPGVDFFEQWTRFLYTQANGRQPQALSQLDQLIHAHETHLLSRGPRFGDELDRLITQLMQVQKVRFEAASQ